MFANKTRVLLTFREDALGRARVFPGLKLAEHRMRFHRASCGALGLVRIQSASGREGRPMRVRGLTWLLRRARSCILDFSSWKRLPGLSVPATISRPRE